MKRKRERKIQKLSSKKKKKLKMRKGKRSICSIEVQYIYNETMIERK